MSPLLILLLPALLDSIVAGWHAPGETGPGMLIVDDDNQPTGGLGGYTQSLQLHTGWNLVSWHIEPLVPEIQMEEILPMWTTSIPPEPTWFNTLGGELYKWDDNDLYWPLPAYATVIWNLDYAYYMRLQESHNWDEFNSKPLFPLGPVTNILPNDAWAHDQNVGSPYASYWFFLGYAAPGYCKLASIPLLPVPPNGNPANFSFEGPFHKLIWDETAPWDWSDLKIIKDDEGRCYIPRPGQGRPAVDQIGTLEPGKGYFLGFSGTGPYTFEGWQNWPQWQNDDFTPPEPKENQSQTASAAHFQYQQYTHWSYPVYVDTVDQAQCPMAAGDEIGIFDGALCVGAAVYEGEFPLIVTAWEDDIATPLEVDGYQFSNPMTFLWYDASENTEAQFTLPPGIEALADDPVAPTHSGFGCGLYGRRSFTEGVSTVNQLPQVYKLGQNYPNPFNAETVIPLELPERSQVKIELFNIRGQNLGTIYEGMQNAGWPKVRYNAAGLASGVYIYRITAQGLENGGKFQNTGKMLLLK